VSKSKSKADAPGEGMKFEEALAELQAIVERIEAGELGLEESVDLFAKATELLTLCRSRLAAAEQRVAELMLRIVPETGEEADGE
jgi:exodeoxyribonuclease VII small subunit